MLNCLRWFNIVSCETEYVRTDEFSMFFPHDIYIAILRLRLGHAFLADLLWKLNSEHIAASNICQSVVLLDILYALLETMHQGGCVNVRAI